MLPQLPSTVCWRARPGGRGRWRSAFDAEPSRPVAQIHATRRPARYLSATVRGRFLVDRSCAQSAAASRKLQRTAAGRCGLYLTGASPPRPPSSLRGRPGSWT
jgi:hypothetical protein